MGDEIVISMNRIGIGNIPSENFSREQSSPADVCDSLWEYSGGLCREVREVQ